MASLLRSLTVLRILNGFSRTSVSGISWYFFTLSWVRQAFPVHYGISYSLLANVRMYHRIFFPASIMILIQAVKRPYFGRPKSNMQWLPWQSSKANHKSARAFCNFFPSIMSIFSPFLVPFGRFSNMERVRVPWGNRWWYHNNSKRIRQQNCYRHQQVIWNGSTLTCWQTTVPTCYVIHNFEFPCNSMENLI